MRRIWAERIVIVIAAGASIATSPKRWSVQATQPPLTSAPGKAMAVTIEASQMPDVSIVDDRGGSSRLTNPTAAWLGRARYFVPAGTRLQRVEIDGRCSTGLCSGECRPPDGAYVRVADTAAVGGWTAEDRSAPVMTVLDPSRPAPSYRVTVESGRLPVALEIEIEGALRHLAPEVRPAAVVPTSVFYVDWTASHAQAAPVTVTWTARATIQGECAGAADCAAPAGEAVRIRSVEPKAPDEP